MFLLLESHSTWHQELADKQQAEKQQTRHVAERSIQLIDINKSVVFDELLHCNVFYDIIIFFT